MPQLCSISWDSVAVCCCTACVKLLKQIHIPTFARQWFVDGYILFDKTALLWAVDHNRNHDSTLPPPPTLLDSFFYSEDRDNKLLRNVGTYLPDHTAWHSRIF
jgi:hypothetical protein